MRLCTAKYAVHLKEFFYTLGLSIGTNPKRYISIILLCTAVSCLGFLRFRQINNARVTFTAHDSPSHQEGAMIFDFLRQNGTLHMIEVLIKSKDGGNLLRHQHRQQLSELTNEIIHNITVETSDGTSLSYSDLCEPYCEKNDAFYSLLDLFSESNSTIFEITYPSSEILGKQIFLGNNLYDVTTEPDSTRILSFTTVLLRYYLTNSRREPMIEFEKQLVALLYESGRYPLLFAQAGSDNLVAKEVKKLGSSTAPYLGVSVVLLCAFLALCSARYQWNESKPVEACLGAIIPFLSGLTTIGIVSASGLAFQSIVVSTLFLILAIGIDDVFIILSAWHRSDKSLDVPHRIAETIRESGCSMTVTTVTNLVSFGNGILSTTPVLQTFAIYSSVASIICFVYQLTVFPAILALTAHQEYRAARSLWMPDTLGVIRRVSTRATKFWCELARRVESYPMRVLTLVTLGVYWWLAGFGVLTMHTDLSIQKMASKEARIVQFKNDADRAMLEMQSVAVLVDTPGDLRNRTRFQQLKEMIAEFENALNSYGKESTICWINPYMDFLSFYEASDEDEDSKHPNFTYTDIPSFLKSEPHFKPMLRYNITKCDENDPDCIRSFLFTTAFTSVVRYNDMYPTVSEWRRIAARFPQFHVFPYTERSNFVDQTHDMVTNIWQTVLSEVICMTISFVFFIPDLVSILAATFSLLSVNMGVFGFLSIWGVGMDPVSTASLLMSIGFSVDISAHISYHYYQVDDPSPRRKLEHVFTNIAWPTMQGGISTMIAMLPILLCPSYLGMVFLKTVILVCVFGLIHGLIVLPVFLSLFSDLAAKFRRPPIRESASNEKIGSAENRNKICQQLTVRCIVAEDPKKF